MRSRGFSVERLESFVRGPAEGLTSTREELERKMDEMEARLSSRISILEEVVRQSSEDIRKLQAEVAAMRSQLARRDDLAAPRREVGQSSLPVFSSRETHSVRAIGTSCV